MRTAVDGDVEVCCLQAQTSTELPHFAIPLFAPRQLSKPSAQFRTLVRDGTLELLKSEVQDLTRSTTLLNSEAKLPFEEVEQPEGENTREPG